MKVLKILTFVFSFFCLIPAHHFIPIPIFVFEFFDGLPLANLPIIIGHILMLFSIIKNDKNIIWILGFLIFGFGYFIVLKENYSYYEYVLRSVPDMLVFFGPYFFLGCLTIVKIVTSKNEIDTPNIQKNTKEN